LKRRILGLPLALFLLVGCSNTTGTPTPRPTPTVPASPRADPELKWTFKTQGAIWGSAAVRDGVVYIGSNDHSLYAVDAGTGAQKWKFATQGEVRARPAFAGDSVIFSSDDGSLYALDAKTGGQRWKSDIHNTHRRVPLDDPNMGTHYDYDFLSSSPVVVDGSVYVGSADGNVYALDAAKGTVTWTFKTADRVRATPAVAGGVVYIGSWDGYLYALKADTGTLVWKYLAGVDGSPRYLTLPIQSTASVADGTVFCASRKASTFALNASTGTQLWDISNGNGNWLESSPVVSGGYVYIGSSLASNLSVFSADGVPQLGFNVAAAAWSTPLVADGIVFIGSEGFPGGPELGGGMWAINVDPDGGASESRWFYSVKNTVEPSGINGVNSSPVLADRVLYFGGLDGLLYALDV
jgi:outer membrane protein assembly factor BamB